MVARPSFDEIAFELTRTIAQRSTCPRLHTASVIMTPDHRLVASGYNGSLPGLEHCNVEEPCNSCDNSSGRVVTYPDNNNYTLSKWELCGRCGGAGIFIINQCLMIDGHCQRTVHSEANAIAQAAKYGTPLNRCHIYVLHQPCLPCTKLIIASGILDIHYSEPYRVEDEATRLAVNMMAESHVNLY